MIFFPLLSIQLYLLCFVRMCIFLLKKKITCLLILYLKLTIFEFLFLKFICSGNNRFFNYDVISTTSTVFDFTKSKSRTYACKWIINKTNRISIFGGVKVVIYNVVEFFWFMEFCWTFWKFKNASDIFFTILWCSNVGKTITTNSWYFFSASFALMMSSSSGLIELL